jgi:hypothetical protein
VEVLRDGTALRLASFDMADAELRLTGADDPAFAALKAAYADVLGGAPPGPPDRGMEPGVIETGDAPMPRSRPVKRLSEGGLAELRAQLVDLLDRGWIQHSTAGNAVAAAPPFMGPKASVAVVVVKERLDESRAQLQERKRSWAPSPSVPPPTRSAGS